MGSEKMHDIKLRCLKLLAPDTSTWASGRLVCISRREKKGEGGGKGRYCFTYSIMFLSLLPSSFIKITVIRVLGSGLKRIKQKVLFSLAERFAERSWRWISYKITTVKLHSDVFAINRRRKKQKPKWFDLIWPLDRLKKEHTPNTRWKGYNNYF